MLDSSYKYGIKVSTCVQLMAYAIKLHCNGQLNITVCSNRTSEMSYVSTLLCSMNEENVY